MSRSTVCASPPPETASSQVRGHIIDASMLAIAFLHEDHQCALSRHHVVDAGGSEPEPNLSACHGLPAVRGAGDVLHARHTQPEFEAPSCMDVAMPELLGPSMSLPSAREVQAVPPKPSPRRPAT